MAANRSDCSTVAGNEADRIQSMATDLIIVLIEFDRRLAPPWWIATAAIGSPPQSFPIERKTIECHRVSQGLADP